MQRRVRNLIQSKIKERLPQIESGSTVEAALIKLQFSDSGALLVMRSKTLLGVFSERDFARASIQDELVDGLLTPVDDIMSPPIVYATPDHRLEECMSLMSKMKIVHLPVLHQGIPVALLSMRHIMEALVEDKEFLIEELTKYVTGSQSPASLLN